ncbi:MAG TPA: Asd/ArgC dimerization domain-containing protein [Terriglobales bacterium]|nr:Asd/ArgC dimerization domain-containing protein [Terriglobales bacterium]
MNRLAGISHSFRVAIVGAATLKGRELKDVLDEMNFPVADVKLLDDDESLGQLDQVGDEATFIQPADPEHFRNVDFAFFASDPDFTGRHWKSALQAGSTVLDLSYALDNEPNVVVRSPWIEKELERESGQQPALEDLNTTTVVVAHPVATVLALLLLRARVLGNIQTIAATVFEPVSEQGKRGMDELHQQTVNLLSFTSLPKDVFDEQVAFNMLGRFGESSSLSLTRTERRIVSHFNAILGSSPQPVPSLMLVQAPTFHAHTFSIYIQFDRERDASDLEKVLTGEHVTVIGPGEDSPSNVSAAGQGTILVLLHRDANNAKGFWIWAAADNLKIAAMTAVECAATLSVMRPLGKVQ